MKFVLIHDTELNQDRFEEYPAWAQYYEPGDVELLSEFGVDREIAKV